MTGDDKLNLRREYPTEVAVDGDGDILITQDADRSESDIVIISPERLSQIIEWLRVRGVKV